MVEPRKVLFVLYASFPQLQVTPEHPSVADLKTPVHPYVNATLVLRPHPTFRHLQFNFWFTHGETLGTRVCQSYCGTNLKETYQGDMKMEVPVECIKLM